MPQANEVASVEALVASVRRTEQLLTILTRQALRDSISAVLEDHTARRLYELTGLKTSREIGQELDLSPSTVSAYWTRWEALGLVVKEGQRYRKTFDDFARDERARRVPPIARKSCEERWHHGFCTSGGSSLGDHERSRWRPRPRPEGTS